MSAPRPSEADVQALGTVVLCALLDSTEQPNSGALALDVARAVLASDWVAARDAEHEREVAGFRGLFDLAAQAAERRLVRAEAAERDLADRNAAIKALHGGTHWCFDANQQGEVFEPGTKWWPCPTYALLPRDDAAGAGGAS